jgi:pimeloyl-ACP methyl ester carboxylesterase
MLKKIALILLVIVVVGVVATSFIVWRYPIALFNWSNRRSLRNTGFVEKKIASPAGEQVVFTKGNGAPLFFLHGAGDHAGAWVKVADFYTADHRVILVDLAGHGDSAPSGEGAISIGMILGSLESVVDDQAPKQNVMIVGNSLGGWLAMLYAQRHPERVERIILVDGGAIRGERPDLVELPTSRDQARELFQSVIDPGSPMPAGFVLDDIVRQSKNGSLGRLTRSGKADMERYLLDGQLRNFPTPTDLIWGESDKLVPITYAQRLKDELPASRLTTIPRCGHVPQQECPRAFSAALKSVLAEAPPQPKIETLSPPAEAATKGKTL